jgi:hypothetical protein
MSGSTAITSPGHLYNISDAAVLKLHNTTKACWFILLRKLLLLVLQLLINIYFWFRGNYLIQVRGTCIMLAYV